MKTRILGLVLIAALAISTTAMAQNEQGRKRNEGQKEMVKKRDQGMKQHRDNFFTEEQKVKMKELRLETAKQVKPLKNELNELNAKQQTLTTADKADLNAINKNIDKISAIKANIQKIMAAQHQEVRAMLSEEQLIKFDMMKSKRGGERGGKPGKMDARRAHHGEKKNNTRG